MRWDYDMVLPDGRLFHGKGDVPRPGYAVVTPRGTYAVRAISTAEERPRVWVRELDEGEAVR